MSGGSPYGLSGRILLFREFDGTQLASGRFMFPFICLAHGLSTKFISSALLLLLRVPWPNHVLLRGMDSYAGVMICSRCFTSFPNRTTGNPVKERFPFSSRLPLPFRTQRRVARMAILPRKFTNKLPRLATKRTGASHGRIACASTTSH